MKKDGLAQYVKNIIAMGDYDNKEEVDECQSLGIRLEGFKILRDANHPETAEFTYPDRHDPYMFSYTSGTTGDSKGVPFTHAAIITQSMATELEAFKGETIISYLPYPHSFE